MARELRDAIANREIGIRFVGRHDLRTGRVVAWVGYMRWEHRLRGEIRPAEFLRVAESTGLAVPLSRAVLEPLLRRFCEAQSAVGRRTPACRSARFAITCFHEEFLSDMEAVLRDGRVPAERLELRISEKAFVACDPDHAFARCARRACSSSSMKSGGTWGRWRRWRARRCGACSSIASWTTAIRSDDVAQLVCRAGLSVANALGFAPIATGVDSAAQRDALLEIGFRYGIGDLYPAVGLTEHNGRSVRPDVFSRALRIFRTGRVCTAVDLTPALFELRHTLTPIQAAARASPGRDAL